MQMSAGWDARKSHSGNESETQPMGFKVAKHVSQLSLPKRQFKAFFYMDVNEEEHVCDYSLQQTHHVYVTLMEIIFCWEKKRTIPSGY